MINSGGKQKVIFKSLKVRNFRTLKNLDMPQLGHINLIIGGNNSGKSSLLEALFLLCGCRNPQLVMNSNVTRGSLLSSPAQSYILETLWKPFFSNLEINQNIEIKGDHFSKGLIQYYISLEQPHLVQLDLIRDDQIIVNDVSNNLSLVLKSKVGNSELIENRIKLAGQSLEIEQVPQPTAVNVAMISSQPMNHEEDAKRLGKLRKQKRGNELLTALKIIEPSLHSIEENSASGKPMIWGDIGMSELIPLATMGNGMLRVTRLVLAIANTPNGIVLIDEIETGLHHSIIEKIWSVINNVAKKFNTHIFATTQSYECVNAAYAALTDNRDFLLHRLEKSELTNDCITYSPRLIETALKHDMEVR